MPDLSTDKSELRREMRARRRALDKDQRKQAAKDLASQVGTLPTWENADRIALYLANDGEIDAELLVERGRETGKQIYLPRISTVDEMQFALWDPGRELVRNRYGIEEPDADATRADIHQLDIVFLPMVAWTLSGHRLGMGGGYYDRILDGINGPLLVGLAYEFQGQAALPREDWDIPVDIVATEASLYQCQETGGS